MLLWKVTHPRKYEWNKLDLMTERGKWKGVRESETKRDREGIKLNS